MALVPFADLRPKYGICYSRTSLDRLEKQGKFPKRVRVGDNRISWHSHELQAHVDGLDRGNATKHRAKKAGA